MTVPRRPSRFLVLAGSRRQQSMNAQLAALAARAIEAHGGVADRASLRDFEVPWFDADAEQTEGLPAGADAFRERLVANDAVVVASPEDNSSMPRELKKLIDWVSRHRPQPFNERYGLLLSASASMVGGNRGLWAVRIPFEHPGARISPDMFSLAQSPVGLDSTGEL